ncbi:ATP-grasp domain-containing protein [Streptomyces boncukensis]|uniref:ATP-grasp domain-containing protein n=1 Tax=Streptomyces boncukensis TaxID=2711219 RepID=A0A6G4X3P0_9ACTN|nr:ATP-grasp domain-containing protein [Streptomyces boncukensis]NGO72125.1 ATP-grasp domain-containing protein [Streptomyces boncukensis]
MRPATADTIALEGVDAAEGLRTLEDLVDEVAFLDRSAFLPASFQPAVPWLHHEPVSPLLGPLPPARPARPARPAPPTSSAAPSVAERAVAVAFAPEHGDHAHQWAAQHGHRLLAPSPAVTARAADKIDSLPLLAEAGVAVVDHVLIPATGRQPAETYWPAHWERAVLQRRENNLIGQGTVALHERAQLTAALERWRGRALRLSRLVPGMSLTVSACAAADRTVVSAVSHQLVGLPELTPGWGTHCGNQLLAPRDLPGGLYTRTRTCARAVGDVLRRHGYRGVFGLDLLVDGDKVAVVEINPRFQTVLSLVQAAEARAGLLPSLGLHVLACLLPTLPPTRSSAQLATPLSQFLVHALRTGRLATVPAPGCYRLSASCGLAHVSPAVALNDLPADTALLWPHALPGTVHAGDELVLVQARERVCPLATRPPLGARAAAWTDRIRTLVRADPRPAGERRHA